MPSFVDLSRLICGLISSWSYSNLTLMGVFLLGYLIFLIQFGNFFGLRNWIAWCFLGNCSPCCRFQEINQKPSLFFLIFQPEAAISFCHCRRNRSNRSSLHSESSPYSASVDCALMNRIQWYSYTISIFPTNHLNRRQWLFRNCASLFG